METDQLDGGDAIVQAFQSLGIEYVLSSPGSEWSSLWEAFARQDVAGGKGPRYLSCWHETLAVDLALGYTAMTGRMQAVVLHAGPGLMQGSMAVSAARQLGIPMLVMSGEALTYGERDGFDPGGQWISSLSIVGGPQRLMEPITKWATQATSPATLFEMVVRAGELAQRMPQGPTYLNVPIENMLEPWQPPARLRKVPPAPKPQASPSDVERVAKLLAGAKKPVIATEGAGRDVQGYEALIGLAELLSIPVVESSRTAVANFPKEHRLHQGFDMKPFLEDTDLVLLVRNRVPWYPPRNRPANATVVSIDEAPLKDFMVYQNLQADVYLEGDVPASLRMLAEAVESLGVDAAQARARGDLWSANHDRLARATGEEEAKARTSASINPATLCATFAEVLPKDAIYVDETTSHRPRNQRHIRYSGPLSYFRGPSGLGQCIGVSLGIKMANPNRPVVALIGDGSFLYNPALASFGFSQEQSLPILVVVYNNGGYRAMRNEHLSYYPKGVAVKSGIFHGETLRGPPFHEFAAPFGGVGIFVDKPGGLKAALQQGWRAVSEGRLAIVNVVLDA